MCYADCIILTLVVSLQVGTGINMRVADGRSRAFVLDWVALLV